MAFLKIAVLSLIFVSSHAFASTVAFKYGINPFFGIKASCKKEGAEVISQVRFYIDSANLASNKDLIPAEIRLSVCVITGEIIGEKHELMVPRFLFTEAPRMQGTFNVQHVKFSKVSVNELKKDQWQVRFFDKSAQPWAQIDPIEMTLNAKAHRPEALRFFVKNKKRWLDATFRVKETK